MAALMSKCPDYVWREIEPEEILSTGQAANESIISMLSNAKMLITMIIVKSITIFLPFFPR